MSDFWMRAVGDEDYVASLRHEKERKALGQQLHSALKALLAEALGGAEQAPIKSSSESFLSFSYALERILTHGLRSRLEKPPYPPSNTRITFWNYLERLEKIQTPEVGSSAVQSFFSKLRGFSKVKSNEGKGRAWIRLALNQNCLDSFLTALVNNRELTNHWYHDHSLLCNVSDSSFFLSLLHGLSPISFELVVDDAQIDLLHPPKLEEEESPSVKKKKKTVRKKKPSLASIESSIDEVNTVQSVIDQEVKKRIEEEFRKKEEELKKRELELLQKEREKQEEDQRREEDLLRRIEEEKLREKQEKEQKEREIHDEHKRREEEEREKINQLIQEQERKRKAMVTATSSPVTNGHNHNHNHNHSSTIEKIEVKPVVVTPVMEIRSPVEFSSNKQENEGKMRENGAEEKRKFMEEERRKIMEEERKRIREEMERERDYDDDNDHHDDNRNEGVNGHDDIALSKKAGRGGSIKKGRGGEGEKEN